MTESLLEAFAEHSRSPFYQVQVVTGACATIMSERVEISFFADRVRHVRERLVDLEPGSGLLRPSGQIEVTPLREHVAAVSLNLQQLHQLRVLADDMIVQLEASIAQTQEIEKKLKYQSEQSVQG